MKTLKLPLITFLTISQSFGALPSGTVWEVRHAGADTAGGGYVTGSSGTDFSQQTSAQVAYTDMVLGAGGTSYTSVLNPVGATLPGNIIQVISGTGCTAGFYEVVSNTTITATLDRSAGTAASVCTANLGGALASLTKLNTAMSTTNNITQTGYVKADATYSIASGITFNMTDSTKGTSININGYTTTRTDGGQPTIQASAINFTLVTISNNNNLSNMTFRNFILDCNSQTGSTGFIFSANGNSAEKIKAVNCTGAYGINLGTSFSVLCRNCWVANYTGGNNAFLLGSLQNTSTSTCLWCIASGGTGLGFQIQPSAVCIVCIAANNSGGSTDGFIVNGSSVTSTVILGAIAYNNGRDGIRFTGDASAGNAQLTLMNSIMFGNAGFQFNNTGVTGNSTAYGVTENYNGLGTGGSGARNNQAAGANDVSLGTTDPFTNGASLNFALSGSTLKALGFPGVLQSGGTGFLDIGALQSQVTGNGAHAIGFVQ